MFNILITDGVNKDEIERLRKSNFNVINEFFDGLELGEKLKDMDALVIRSKNKITKEIIDKACEGNRLKLIIRSGVGLDNIEVDYAESKGIKIMNTPCGSTVSVAELTICQIINIARFVNISNVRMREGKWEKKHYIGTEIYGKTLGIIGMGRIGKEVAKRACAMGMNIIYYDILGKMDVPNKYRFCEFEEVLANSDFLTIHIPYDKEKGYLITKKEIEKMKDRVYLINHARGGLVCEKDLINALDNGKIEAVALDVFESEPKFNLELVNHPMVSPTPHIGASTVEAQKRISAEIVEIITEYFQSEEGRKNIRLAL
ncbi:D-2-hydroxyacid dehydrogenase [Romboutsia sp. 1001713B170207_170306_H8]|uniref:D-2-hydroxyacid dehydrogenase n=1 Tax=Romboutsia sp. 1001713B170207_170306_H8 TaxID=2787112 RepID=UPI0008214260|nr:D-2-hydroxyacid dehydrogenase [Romboutsia sp. 1001713B170207_170306_H8]SCH92983.1 D-3-phosphoglycerate dehydrogenase [uncultured Clostridium sp.]